MEVLQAVALAAVLVVLGAVAGEAGTINCLTSNPTQNFTRTNDNNCVREFNPNGEHSNTWQFGYFINFGEQQSFSPIVTLTISGTPNEIFALNIFDVVGPGFTIGQGPAAGLSCVPNFPGDVNSCAFFDVQVYSRTNSAGSLWQDGVYDLSIVWNVPPIVDPDTGLPSYQLTILEAPSGNYGFSDPTTRMLSDIRYAPVLPFPDPGIGGRGNEFSTFGVFTGTGLANARPVDSKAALLVTVPEPASLLLLGTGLAGLGVRARRRKR